MMRANVAEEQCDTHGSISDMIGLFDGIEKVFGLVDTSNFTLELSTNFMQVMIFVVTFDLPTN